MSSITPSSSVGPAINACVKAYGTSLMPPGRETASDLAYAVFFSHQKKLSQVEADVRDVADAKAAAMKLNERLTYKEEKARLWARYDEQLKTYELFHRGGREIGKLAPVQIWARLVKEERGRFHGFLPRLTCRALINLGLTCWRYCEDKCERDAAASQYKADLFSFADLIHNYWICDRLPLSGSMQRLVNSLAGSLHDLFLCSLGQKSFLLQFAQGTTLERNRQWQQVLHRTAIASDRGYFSWIADLINGECSLDAALKFCVRVLSPDLVKAPTSALHALGFVAGMMITKRLTAEVMTSEWDASFMATQLDKRMYKKIENHTLEPSEDEKLNDAISLFKGAAADPYRLFFMHAVRSTRTIRVIDDNVARPLLFNPKEQEELLHPIYRGLAWSRRVAGLGAWQHQHRDKG